MKNITIKFVITLAILTIGFFSISAQDADATISPDSQVAEGLDLYAVAELFKDSKNLEEFEQALNNPVNGINKPFRALSRA